MSNSEKQYNTIEDQLKDGSILKVYSAKSFLNVIPCPDIHKVKFSIVKIGSGGKEHCDFYMKTSDMRKLCANIDKGIAYKTIESEDAKASYPAAVIYTTGTDGSKKISIGNGSSGYRVQIQNKVNDKYERMFTTISERYSALQDMSFWYKAVMGLISVSRYYGHLVDIFWEGVEDRKKYSHKDYNPDDYEQTPVNTQTEDNTQNSTNAQQPNNTPQNSTNRKEEIKKYSIVPKSSAKIVDGFKGWAKIDIKCNNADTTLFFSPVSIKEMPDNTWIDFQRAASNAKSFNIYAFEKQGKMYFKKFA